MSEDSGQGWKRSTWSLRSSTNSVSRLRKNDLDLCTVTPYKSSKRLVVKRSRNTGKGPRTGSGTQCRLLLWLGHATEVGTWATGGQKQGDRSAVHGFNALMHWWSLFTECRKNWNRHEKQILLTLESLTISRLTVLTESSSCPVCDLPHLYLLPTQLCGSAMPSTLA